MMAADSGTVPLVLVTGASGFIASHCIKLLQESGDYKIRGTVRSLKNREKCEAIRNLVNNPRHEIDLVEASLLEEQGWVRAVKGCTYVLHIASPFVTTAPKHEDELIKPAVEGTLNVLKAASEYNVKRVVLTSSMVAIFIGNVTKELDESLWSDTNLTAAYEKSKTLAERAAWDFVSKLPVDKKMELAVVNPGFVLGPILLPGTGASVDNVKKLLMREMMAVPDIHTPMVDVRDVAKAHLKAMTVPEAAGNRHLVASNVHSFLYLANALANEFDSQGYNVPTKKVPKFLVWLMSWFANDAKTIYPYIGMKLKMNNSRMKDVLHIEPTDIAASVVEMAHTMIEKGIVEKRPGYRGRSKDVAKGKGVSKSKAALGNIGKETSRIEIKHSVGNEGVKYESNGNTLNAGASKKIEELEGKQEQAEEVECNMPEDAENEKSSHNSEVSNGDCLKDKIDDVSSKKGGEKGGKGNEIGESAVDLEDKQTKEVDDMKNDESDESKKVGPVPENLHDNKDTESQDDDEGSKDFDLEETDQGKVESKEDDQIKAHVSEIDVVTKSELKTDDIENSGIKEDEGDVSLTEDGDADQAAEGGATIEDITENGSDDMKIEGKGDKAGDDQEKSDVEGNKDSKEDSKSEDDSKGNDSKEETSENLTENKEIVKDDSENGQFKDTMEEGKGNEIIEEDGKVLPAVDGDNSKEEMLEKSVENKGTETVGSGSIQEKVDNKDDDEGLNSAKIGEEKGVLDGEHDEGDVETSPGKNQEAEVKVDDGGNDDVKLDVEGEVKIDSAIDVSKEDIKENHAKNGEVEVEISHVGNDDMKDNDGIDDVKLGVEGEVIQQGGVDGDSSKREHSESANEAKGIGIKEDEVRRGDENAGKGEAVPSES